MSIHGVGAFVNQNVISVTNSEGTTEIHTEKVIIATGSKPITPDIFHYDKNRVITSTEALNIDKVPAKMVVVGGGVIGSGIRISLCPIRYISRSSGVYGQNHTVYGH
jgi:pyruvate/2-oxoglutarate dehydrogenase complex dihydrolipoamide dehydrogenase (E3) component